MAHIIFVAGADMVRVIRFAVYSTIESSRFVGVWLLAVRPKKN
jgi:hypothetical protein